MANRPTGTVTLLFAAIEGSTALWEDYPKDMQAAVARYHQILQGTVEPGRGNVFETVGDAWRAAFASAPNALRAALEAQRAFCADRWSEPIDPLVRMALHTGFVEERDGDYSGPALDRVGRLVRAGHGGQILVSGATHGLVSDQLEEVDPQAWLVELGEYRLGDLTPPERVYGLVAPGLPDEFPPLRGGEADERYRIKDFLGGGGMALVFLAHDVELDQEVAYKRIKPRFAQDEEFVDRFRREARSAAKLRSHPNIVPIYDRGRTAQGTYYLVMEYVPGGTLKDLIEKEGPLPVSEAVRLTLQVAQALREAHERGIVHRDVKPQNVLLTEKGDAKLADFGIARAAFSMTITVTGQVAPHTDAYASPEQKKGRRVDGRSDLYSLGVVLHEMLTGERPAREAEVEVPEQLRGIMARLLAEDRDERYPDAAALIEDLERVSDELRSARAQSAGEAGGDLTRAAPALGSGAQSEAPEDEGRIVEQEREANPDGAASLTLGADSREEQVQRRRWKAWSWVLAAWLVAGIVLAVVIWLGLGPPGSNTPTGAETSDLIETAPVPDVVGDTGSGAEQTLRSEGFEVEVATRGVPENDVGEVVEQDPAPNSAEQKGSTVTITVGELNMIEVPDLAGTTQEEAQRRVGEDFRIDDGGTEVSGEPEGDIISQNPTAGSRAEQGSELSVVTSAGQPANQGDIFADDFSDASGGWDEGEVEDGDVVDEYTNGGYRVYNAPSAQFSALAPAYDAGSLGDAIVEVDATRIGDAPEEGTSFWGIFCRGRDDNGDGAYEADYRMVIRDDGYAAIQEFADSESTLATVLVDDSFSDAIRQGSETNHIRVDCVGSELALYVNGQKVVEAEDAESGTGEVGVFVSSVAEKGPGADILFDNFQVSTPP